MSVYVFKPAPGSNVLGKQPLPASEVPLAQNVDVRLPPLTIMSQNLRGLGHAAKYTSSKFPDFIRYISDLEPGPDFVFIQEILGKTDPLSVADSIHKQIQAIRWWYWRLEKGKDKPQEAYDTAILVHNGRFKYITYQESASSSCQTLVGIYDLGLLLVNVHGSPKDNIARRDFFEALLSLLSHYKANGWKIIIGGDFNVAPRECDRPDGMESKKSRDFVYNLCSVLGIVDVAACARYTDIRTNSHLTYSKTPTTNPKKEDTPDVAETPKRAAKAKVKTTKDADNSASADTSSVVEIDRAKSDGYISRIDLFLIPKNLVDENRIEYSNRRIKLKGKSSYDHDEIMLTILDQSTPASDKASSAKAMPQEDSLIPGSYFCRDFFNDKEALAKIDAVYSSADMSGKLFAVYEACFAKVDEIHADYLKSIDQR